MNLRCWFLVAIALMSAAPACKKPSVQQTVVVHLFRDLHSPYAHELDHRILEFQSSNPRLQSGAPVVVESINEIEYETALKNDFDKNVKVEVVILNDPNDVTEIPTLTAALANATNICAAVKACPAMVPALITTNATAERATASQLFVDYLAKQK